jgi:hypothetical protein
MIWRIILLWLLGASLTFAGANSVGATDGYLGIPTFALAQPFTGSSDPVQNITGEHYIDVTDLQLPGP